jgi:hypothetical protein
MGLPEVARHAQAVAAEITKLLDTPAEAIGATAGHGLVTD